MQDLRIKVLEENVKVMRVRSAERGILIGDLFGEVFNFYKENCEDEPDRVRGDSRAVWWIVNDDVSSEIDEMSTELGVLKYILVNAAIAFYFEHHPQK